MSGAYVVFEGPDNSGKTTLRDCVRRSLEIGGVPVQAGRFPSDGAIGELIRNVLRGEELVDIHAMLYLFYADAVDRDKYLARLICEHGITILVDRHPVISGTVYQPEDHGLDEIAKVYSSYDLLKPDHLFFLDIPIEVSMEREKKKAKYKDVVYEGRGAEYLGRIHRRYSLLHKTVSDRLGRPAVVLDGTKPVEELRDIVLKRLER
jgi:dTMP kinase